MHQNICSIKKHGEYEKENRKPIGLAYTGKNL